MTFQRISTMRELREHFRLRHDVYMDCGYRHVADPHGLDIDAYDLYAEHLAAYEHDVRGGVRMVGGIRLIWERRPSPLRAATARILWEAGRSVKDLVEQRPTPLPSEPAFDYSTFVEGVRSAGLPLVEFSRTFSVPWARGRLVGVGLAHGIHGWARQRGVRYGIGSCATNHVPYYERLGVRVLEAAGIHVYPGIGVLARALVIDLESLPAEVDAITRRVGSHLAGQGSYCLCDVGITAGQDVPCAHTSTQPHRKQRGSPAIMDVRQVAQNSTRVRSMGCPQALQKRPCPLTTAEQEAHSRSRRAKRGR